MMADVANTSVSSSADHLKRLAGIVILAGGASKRMGSPKAELILPSNERLLDYHVREALELSATVLDNVPIMVADNGRGFSIDPNLIKKDTQSPIFHITDYLSDNTTSGNELSSNELSINDDKKQIETGGALVAIESALQSVASLKKLGESANVHASWLLVISCDSLIPATNLWQKLQPYIAQATDKFVICLNDEQHLYPLLGLYRLDIETNLKQYIDDGQRQVMKFIKPIVQPVDFVKEWQYLTNFNTPKDFEHACLTLNNL